MIVRANRRKRLTRLILQSGFVVVVLGSCYWGVGRLSAPPVNRAAAEAELDRPLLFYDVWDGTPYVVFRLDDRIHFDKLILDVISIDWPPAPQWQWSGVWSYMDATNDPASVGFTDYPITGVIYGQINDPGIVALEIFAADAWHRYDVSAPGYAIRLSEGQGQPTQFRWLDAEGRVVWSVRR